MPAAGACQGKGAGRAARCTRSGHRDGAVRGRSLRLGSWAACAAVVWRVWTRSLTRPVSRTVRLLTGDSAGAPGLFRVDADTAPFGTEDATPGSRACVRVHALLGRVGRAGLLGAFWYASPRPKPRTATPKEATAFGGHTKTTTTSPPNQGAPLWTPTQLPSSKPQQRQPHR